MSKPTPGPWEHEPSTYDDLESYGVWCGDGIGLVCTVYSGLEPAGSSEANARLIAAAPDLLAACEAMFVHFPGCACDFGPIGGPKCFPCKVRAAVAKAKGGA
jgi:hypothetical protein